MWAVYSEKYNSGTGVVGGFTPRFSGTEATFGHDVCIHKGSHGCQRSHRIPGWFEGGPCHINDYKTFPLIYTHSKF